MPKTKKPPAGSHDGRPPVSLVDAGSLTKSHSIPQPSTVTQLRALRLIGTHHVRPEVALALAALEFGGAA